MKTLLQAICVFICAAMCACATSIDIAFTPSALNVTPGETDVAVYATLTNTSTTDPVFINSDSLSVPESSTVTDDFFANVPISLDPSASSGLIELFQFDVAPGAPRGSFTGTYQLAGGTGVANQYDLDPLGTQNFTVEVTPTAEVSTELLVAAGLIILACLSRKLRSVPERQQEAASNF